MSPRTRTRVLLTAGLGVLVAGRVVGPDGLGATANVRAIPVGKGAGFLRVVHATTDGEGNFELQDLGRSPYELRARFEPRILTDSGLVAVGYVGEAPEPEPSSKLFALPLRVDATGGDVLGVALELVPHRSVAFRVDLPPAAGRALVARGGDGREIARRGLVEGLRDLALDLPEGRVLVELEADGGTVESRWIDVGAEPLRVAFGP